MLSEVFVILFIINVLVLSGDHNEEVAINVPSFGHAWMICFDTKVTRTFIESTVHDH